jgi:DNA-directed RNA polymerase I, II, and III subunit RPABC1
MHRSNTIFNSYTERMVGQGSHHGIVIYQKSITSSGVRVINEMSGKFHLESFHEDDLLVNITKHVLVPKHHVLTLEEKRILLERYHLKDSQLPRIQPSDPVAKYFGLKRGQVVKITRASETAGRYITYRLCM